MCVWITIKYSYEGFYVLLLILIFCSFFYVESEILNTRYDGRNRYNVASYINYCYALHDTT